VKRGGWLKRTTRLRSSGKRLKRCRLKARGGHLFKKDRDPTYLARVRTWTCVMRGLSPCWGRVDPHHTIKQSHAGADHAAVPLCQGHHDEVDRIPRSTWRRRYPGLNLLAIARELYEDYAAGLSAGGR
jgi:hypothetical protein